MEVGRLPRRLPCLEKSFKSPALWYKGLSCLLSIAHVLHLSGHYSRAQRNPQFMEGNRTWMEMGLCLFLTQSPSFRKLLPDPSILLLKLSTLYPCEVALNCVCSSSRVIYCPLSGCLTKGLRLFSLYEVRTLIAPTAEVFVCLGGGRRVIRNKRE